MLDVGQGDAVLIGQDGAYCLIDTGPSDAKGDLVRDLQLAGISKLDYLVLTHPHADHTGGAREVLRNFAVGQLLVPPWDAQASGETADWPRGLFDLAAEQGTDVITAEDGTVYPLGSGHPDSFAGRRVRTVRHRRFLRSCQQRLAVHAV